MAIEVLLMTDVENVGREGEVVSVADGFARNYLFPKKLAATVNATTKRKLAKSQRDREQTRVQELTGFKELANRISTVSCTITVKTGEGERMYGSVSAVDVVRALHDQGIQVERHAVVLEHPLKELGVFDVPIRLHPEVETTVKVWVVEE